MVGEAGRGGDAEKGRGSMSDEGYLRQNMNRIHDRRAVKLEDVLKADFIPFKGGRPKRDEPISDSDVVDLKIALETRRTLERLFQRV